MPIDLVIDERDGPKPDPQVGLGDSNNNAAAAAAGRASADTTHTDGASTPDVVSTGTNFSIHIVLNFYLFLSLDLWVCLCTMSFAAGLSFVSFDIMNVSVRDLRCFVRQNLWCIRV